MKLLLWHTALTLAIFFLFFQPVQATIPSSNSLVKASQPTVYYHSADGKRYVFLNENIYKTWYPNFDSVVTITDQELASLAIGGSVTHRPGVKMVKIQTDPKVYAIARGGVLRWIMTEEIASTLYGQNWAWQVEDVSDAFFTNYRTGEPIASSDAYSLAAELNASVNIDADLSARSSLTAPLSPTPTLPSPTHTFDWKQRIDGLYFAAYNRSIDQDGRLILTDGRFKVILPESSAEDYGKVRLYQLRVCKENLEPKLGAPTKTDLLVDETRIITSDGISACCGPAPDYSVVNLETEQSFQNIAFGSDAYWKQQNIDLNICLGGHEEVHRNVLGSVIASWANEGLATYYEQTFRKSAGHGSKPTLISCGDTTFQAIGYSSGIQEEIPYRNVLLEWSFDPRLYYYLTGACFWDYIARTYGETAIRSIIDQTKSIPEPPPGSDSGTYNELFIKNAVIPVVGEGAWTFLNRIGIPNF